MRLVSNYNKDTLLAEASIKDVPDVFVCPRMRAVHISSFPCSITGCALKVNQILMGLSAPLRITRLKEVYIRETYVAFVIVWLDVPGLYELGSGEVTAADYEICVHDTMEQCNDVPAKILNALKQMKPP